MTAMPAHRHEPDTFDHPLTIGEYAELGVTKSGYTELIEGSLLMSPSPTPKHNKASLALAVQLLQQLPADLDVIQDVDIDLKLTAPDPVVLDHRHRGAHLSRRVLSHQEVRLSERPESHRNLCHRPAVPGDG
ncbi:MAG TPA: hypothetical protein VGR06_43650 [Actinophytocola sp.]|jgi:hypothetical protein|uniref:hypothetical protein n=1 Tax=Actinophytocola sp. TaxID=1872138 RepID=UPI002E0C3B85|nr:hypothetical protein [Actinophytocola sp.]